jgi:bifunctional non-homologous end joining protein LigD
MLATLVENPFDAKGWVYEEKYDGYRLLAYKEGQHVSLMSRNDIDYAANYPEVAEAVAKLSQPALLLDGEVVVFDPNNVSRFQLLQQSTSKRVYAVFDCLYADSTDLRRHPLSERREILEKVVGKQKGLMLSRRLAANGLQAYDAAKRLQYEGLIAKDLRSPYIETRSGYWRKIKVKKEDEFVIAGYTAPSGSRKYFGALLLGAHQNGKLLYLGKVGTGFNEHSLADLYAKFQPLVAKQSVLADPPRERDVTFLKPKLVAQIAYQEITSDRKLRQPVFLGLREDKSPDEVTIPEPSA